MAGLLDGLSKEQQAGLLSGLAELYAGLEKNPAHPPEGWNRGVRNTAKAIVGGVLGIPQKAFGISNAWQRGERTPEMAGEMFGTALDVAAGGAPGAVRGALGATGGRLRDPNLWHDLSRIELPKPVSEMSATHVPTKTINERVITPADMELPAIGDRTTTGSRLTGYNGYKFGTPVEMQGGHGFMAEHADKGVAWASNPGVITKIANKTKKLAESGDPVYFPYTAMHNEGGDFSHHVSDTLAEALKQTKLSREAQREFNRDMKADHIDFGAVKDWPGVSSENLREYLINAPGDVRNKLAKIMDTRKFQNLGFPSVAEARHAVTDPRLLDAPRGSAGLSVAKLDPNGVSVPGASQHRTYSTDIAGDYIGGLGRMIPRDVFYPDIVKGYQALGSDPNLFMALGRTGAPIAQKATPKWVDTVSRWMELNPKDAMKFGLVGAGGSGLLASGDEQ
jgi:hypothetical protein